MCQKPLKLSWEADEDEPLAGGSSDDNAKVRMEATVRASIPHPALLVPMTRSRGVGGCGVCTNGTGGHFAKGVGCSINGGRACPGLADSIFGIQEST